jgi:hypothetical protein
MSILHSPPRSVEASARECLVPAMGSIGYQDMRLEFAAPSFNKASLTDNDVGGTHCRADCSKRQILSSVATELLGQVPNQLSLFRTYSLVTSRKPGVVHFINNPYNPLQAKPHPPIRSEHQSALTTPTISGRSFSPPDLGILLSPICDWNLQSVVAAYSRTRFYVCATTHL